MSKRRYRVVFTVPAAACALGIASGFCAAFVGSGYPARAADYPTKPIRLLVGFPPGGGIDTTARGISPKLAERLGQQIVVDNRAGATGNIATELVARAAPDGYTVLLGSIAALAVNPSLFEKLAFDPLRDLAPVTRAVDSTNILVVQPAVQARSVKELVALAKSKPGALNGGSAGVGGAGHLALELFNLSAATRITHVPYKGGAPVMLDLLAGNIHFVFATAASAIPHVKAGKIYALAVTTAKRSAMAPELPTVAEAGLPGFEANNWYGFAVPAKTPRSIINRLNQEIVATMTLPEIKDFLFRQGLEIAPSTPEEFGAYIRSETVKWAKVIKAAGIKAN